MLRMQSTLVILTLLLISCLGFSSTVVDAATAQAIVRYHSSGRYQRQLDQQIAIAHNYLKERIAINKKRGTPKRLAILLDLNNVALSSYENEKRIDFSSDPIQTRAFESSANEPAIPGILKLFNYAKQNNVHVFFISDRNRTCREEVQTNLHRAGYAGWNGLIFRGSQHQHQRELDFHRSARIQLLQKKYDIVETLSDKNVCLVGGYSDKMVKLPNPFIPE